MAGFQVTTEAFVGDSPPQVTGEKSLGLPASNQQWALSKLRPRKWEVGDLLLRSIGPQEEVTT